MERLVKSGDVNLGGVVELMAIPVESYLRVRHDRGTGYKFLEVKNRENIIVMPAERENKVIWEETQEQAEGGELWTQKVSGVLPSADTLNTSLMERLMRGRWLVLTKTSNGCVRLSGQPDVPMKFNSQSTSGEGAAGLNGRSFTFECAAPAPSLVIRLERLEDI